MTGLDFARMSARRATPTPSPVPADQKMINEISSAMDSATGKAGDLMDQMPIIVSRLLMALGVIVAGLILLKIFKWIISKVIRRKNVKYAQRADTLRSVVSSICSYIMYFLIIAVVMRIFGMNLNSILTVAGVGGIAIGFGAQTLIKDILSGLFIWGEGSIAVGDLVDINDLSGTVEAISIRTTRIRKYNGDLITIPNGDIRTITNMSRGFRRAVVNIRCPYEEDQNRIVEILRDEMNRAAQEMEEITEVPEVMSIASFETDAVMLQIAAVCPLGSHWKVEREIRSRVKARFDAEGIEMPHYVTPYFPKH